MPAKATKWGYKIQTLVSFSGYVQKLRVKKNGAAPGESKIKRIEESGYVVFRLVKRFNIGSDKIFFDKYFFLPDLITQLKMKIEFDKPFCCQ